MNSRVITESEIDLPVSFDAEAVVATVEEICVNEALYVTMKSTLKKYPGSIHWHFKRREEPGVLEVTWWPCGERNKISRLWLSAHSRRQSAWISDAMLRLKMKMEAQLSK